MKLLEIFGSGFWDSKDILVKFSRSGHPEVPSRSAPGKFIGNRITCKPPRLSEPGDYEISVTMNGKTFVSNPSCILNSFADPTIIEVSPKIVDLLEVNCKFAVSLTGSHFDSMPDFQDQIVVMVRTLNQDDSCPGLVFPGVLTVEQEAPAEQDDDSMPSARASTAASTAPVQHGSALAFKLLVIHKLCNDSRLLSTQQHIATEQSWPTSTCRVSFLLAAKQTFFLFKYP